MKILLVNNETKRLDEFRLLLQQSQLTVTTPAGLASVTPDDFNAVILSGSYVNSVVGHEDHYRHELDLIASATAPVIGICLGIELIARVYGGTLVRLPEKIRGWQDIDTVNGTRLFETGKKWRVYESHRWAVTDLSVHLTGIARSGTGWEIVRHAHKPIYGLQFHPEVAGEENSDGKYIFNRILTSLT